jgi:GntR family transcriptional regulator
VARYYQLYELLSGALNDGSIAPGSVLPSEPELVARHRLSRTTVRRALARLEREGRIERRQGRGTFAREEREQTRLCLNLASLYKELPALASRTSVALLRFETDSVPAALRELQPQIGTRVLVIQRVRIFRGAQYQLSTAYVPEVIGRLIRKGMLGRYSLLTVLDQLGLRAATVEHSTCAVAADLMAAEQLKVPLGSPLLRMRIVFRDSRRRVCAICESVSRPDRFLIRAALERNPSRKEKAAWRLKVS